MDAALSVVGLLLMFAALICGLIILINAFQDEIWKGVVSLLCGLYLLYYAFAEFDHENKWLLVGVWIGGGILGRILLLASGDSTLSGLAGF